MSRVCSITLFVGKGCAILWAEIVCLIRAKNRGKNSKWFVRFLGPYRSGSTWKRVFGGFRTSIEHVVREVGLRNSSYRLIVSVCMISRGVVTFCDSFVTKARVFIPISGLPHYHTHAHTPHVHSPPHLHTKRIIKNNTHLPPNPYHSPLHTLSTHNIHLPTHTHTHTHTHTPNTH